MNLKWDNRSGEEINGTIFEGIIFNFLIVKLRVVSLYQIFFLELNPVFVHSFQVQGKVVYTARQRLSN